MSKVVNLTESDLVRLVKKIIVEQDMNSTEYDTGRINYIQFLQKTIQQLGTNDANEPLNPNPTKILTEVINRTNKLLELYKRTSPQQENYGTPSPKKNIPPTKTEPYGLETGRRKGLRDF